MIDFKKKLGLGTVEKKSNPIELYKSLDRKSEIGPLRPSQIHILDEWYKNYQNKKNLIIKLNTGEGKTLIGLLILLSKINSKDGPCLYICPNRYLFEQTCLEADKFGIPYCIIESNNEIPNDFTIGNKFLITYVQKVFHGLSIFGIDNNSAKVNNIVLDDSHACIDSIKDSFTIKVKRDHPLYKELLNLFEDDLKSQGEGSFIDIIDGEYNTLLPIPYWAWIDKKSEVLKSISKYKTDDKIKFVWPIIKDNIDKCLSFVTGYNLEILPTFIPINKFGSFDKAKQRILMSATTQEDSFFIKGFGFDIESVKNPLNIPTMKWSGEKMILIPSLIDDELDRDLIITRLCKPNDKIKFGIVSIVPDFKKQKQYETVGAEIAHTDNIYDIVNKLKTYNFGKPVVFVNRYDGIDLPDQTCRILIIDSKPFMNSLIDRYEENCRETSDIINIKIAQKIEQGLGRSVRGERDYSVIVIIGSDLIKFMKSQSTNKYFSIQTQKQIEIGLKVGEFAQEDLVKEESKFHIINSLINQVLSRDDGWKQFYINEMNNIELIDNQNRIYEILKKEREAEEHYYNNNFQNAVEIMQKLSDHFNDNLSEKAWYQQTLARFKYGLSKMESNTIQKSAFNNNRYLLKPKDGINYIKLHSISENRIKRIKEWCGNYSSNEEVKMAVESILNDFSFGIDSEKFEESLKSLGELLGFLSQRPDREFKKGPDNLWCGVDNKYIMFECKSEVKNDRNEITKSEAGQMNSHCGWFESEYGMDIKVRRVLVIPTNKLSYYSNFTHDIKILRKNKIKELKDNIKGFINEIIKYNIKDFSDEKLQEIINFYKLDNESIFNSYYEDVIKNTTI